MYPTRTCRIAEIKPGDIYEDCMYHPYLCPDAENRDVWGFQSKWD